MLQKVVVVTQMRNLRVMCYKKVSDYKKPEGSPKAKPAGSPKAKPVGSSKGKQVSPKEFKPGFSEENDIPNILTEVTTFKAAF